MNIERLSLDILSLIGSKDNVISVYHCVTRLRFMLRDENLADTEAIRKLDGVLGVAEQNGQYQVIIGNQVGTVYLALQKELSPHSDNIECDHRALKDRTLSFSFKTLGNNVLAAVAGIFTPILPAIAGVGLIKALVVLLSLSGWLAVDSGNMKVLSAIADSAFYFLPMLLAVSVARRFKTNEYLALAVAGTLMAPQFVQSLIGGISVLTFLGLPLTVVNYASSVVPIILTIWLMSYIERALNRIIPDALKIIIVPTVLLLIICPTALIAIGPLGTWLGNGLAFGIKSLLQHSGLLAGAVLGGLIQVIVITGMHYGIVAIIVQAFATNGVDYITPATIMGVFGQAGATLAVMLMTKDKKQKSLSGSALISALLGITEPAIYGVTLKYKTPFLAAAIGGAAGGAISGHFGSTANAIGVLGGLPSLPMYAGSTFVWVITGIIVSFTIAAVMTKIFGIKE